MVPPRILGHPLLTEYWSCQGNHTSGSLYPLPFPPGGALCYLLGKQLFIVELWLRGHCLQKPS